MMQIKTDKDVISDASRKLETVFAIMTEMEKRGNTSITIELAKALLQATRKTLEEAIANERK